MSKSPETVNPTLFPHPFSKAYWIEAAKELKRVRVLVFAALMIALRVLLKMVSIPIGLDLRINTAFFVNAYGAAVFGPVVAIVAAAISDTLGCILFPTGTYFFPFIFIEIAGSLVFALCFYRAHISATRVIVSRFCIDFFVNIVLNTPIMMIYYHFVLGKYYAIVDLPRIVKNLVMFPIESVLLILFFQLVIPPTKKVGFIQSDVDKLKFSKRTAALLIALFVAGSIAVAGFSIYTYNTSSLSAKYSATERLERNTAMRDIVTENADFGDSTVVAIIESATPKFMDPNVTYEVAIYTVDQAKLDEQIEAYKAEDPESDYGLDTLNGYSRSPASKDAALVSAGHATIVVDKKTDALVSYTDDID